MRSLILLFTSSSFYCILLHLAAAQQQQQGDEIISNNDTIRVEAGISANGLRAGSPTNIKFFFGHEVEEEWQDDDDGVGVVGVPESSSDRMGLVRIGNGTRLILDFGPEFIYNQREARQPDANILVDLGVAENNFIYGSPCPYKYVGNEGAAPTTIDEETRIRRKAMSCGQWTAAFGSSKNQIVIRGSEEQGFQSTRMKEIGIKFAHVHPELGTSSGLYRNGQGICIGITTSYCVDDADCGEGKSCIRSQVKGSVKATVVDGSGNILYRGQQKVDFESSATHQVFATNMGLTRDEEIVESIDYQRIQVAQQAIHVSREQADLLVASGPYAPRFVLFTPSIPELAFPQPSYRATGIITSDTEAELHLELENASGGYDDEHIGMIKLERPSEDSKAQLMLPVEASNYPSLNIMGGSPFAMGVDFNHGNQTLPGIYIVRITLFDGAMAQSHLIVRPPDEESTPVPSTMAPTTISSESQAPLVPSTMVPTTISSESQAPSSMAAETDSPTNVTPTSSPLPQNSSSIAPTSLPTLSPTTMKPTSFPSKSPVQTASKASLTPRSPARDIGFLWIGAAAGATVLLVLFYFGLNRPKRQGNDMTDQNNNQAKEPHGSINSRDSSAV